jgi:aryl-alcohol dehydrogenase-like predicted oxidoreductase
MYQIHWPQPDEDIEEGWSAVAELVKEGKVRYAGVSNFSVAQLKRIQPIHRVTFLQPPYSMLNRSIEAELLPYCEAEDIGIVSYSPMQKGLLSGKVTREWADALPADDHRRNDPQFNEPLLAKNIALTKALAEIAHRYGRNSAELAIAWVLRQPRVTAAIVGARKPGQIKETVFGGKFAIKPEDLARIDEALATRG